MVVAAAVGATVVVGAAVVVAASVGLDKGEYLEGFSYGSMMGLEGLLTGL